MFIVSSVSNRSKCLLPRALIAAGMSFIRLKQCLKVCEEQTGFSTHQPWNKATMLIACMSVNRIILTHLRVNASYTKNTFKADFHLRVFYTHVHARKNINRSKWHLPDNQVNKRTEFSVLYDIVCIFNSFNKNKEHRRIYLLRACRCVWKTRTWKSALRPSTPDKRDHVGG